MAGLGSGVGRLVFNESSGGKSVVEHASHFTRVVDGSGLYESQWMIKVLSCEGPRLGGGLFNCTYCSAQRQCIETSMPLHVNSIMSSGWEHHTLKGCIHYAHM